MKQMEYKVTIITDEPVAPSDVADNIREVVPGTVSVVVTNYRILPTPKAAKS